MARGFGFLLIIIFLSDCGSIPRPIPGRWRGSLLISSGFQTAVPSQASAPELTAMDAV
jgi:hypothetical protein